MFNKNIISHRIIDKIARRPDIYQNDENKKAYIIDITIIKDDNYFKSYCNKININHYKK